MSVTRLTASTISFMVLPAATTSPEPWVNQRNGFADQAFNLFGGIRTAACQSTNFACHHGQTRAPAHPHAPLLPPRVSARILIWKAILLITAVISEIFFELVEILPMVLTTRDHLAATAGFTRHLPPACWHGARYRRSVSPLR